MKATRAWRKNDEKVDTKSVKEIVEPAPTVRSEESVEAALEKLRAQGIESSAVTDQGGKLLGSVSKNQMNRKVGGLGHDPQTSPVEPQIDKDVACCSEDQTIGEAEKVMLVAKVDEVPVVTQDKLLVGKVTLRAIAQKETCRETRRTSEQPTERRQRAKVRGQKSEVEEKVKTESWRPVAKRQPKSGRQIRPASAREVKR